MALTTGCSLIAYADDLIVYNKNKKPLSIQKNLQLATEKLFGYYQAWKLKVTQISVNTDKCKSILFRSLIRSAKYSIPQQYKLFELKENTIGNKKI